jgi:hypothetical protein
MIGTAIEWFALTGGSSEGGRFGIEDNTSDQSRKVDFQDNGLALESLSEFIVDGVPEEVFVGFDERNMWFENFNQTGETEYDNYSFLWIFNSQGDNLANTWPSNSMRASLIVQGVKNIYVFERVYVNSFGQWAFIIDQIDTSINLDGFFALINNTVNVFMNIPAIEEPTQSRSISSQSFENLEDLKSVFITEDNRLLRAKQKPIEVPNWQKTLDKGGELEGAFIPFKDGERAFQIYGNADFSPFFYLNQTPDPLLPKVQIGVFTNQGDFPSGLRFFNNRIDVASLFKYDSVAPFKMLTDDQFLPDVGFTKKGYSHYFEMKAGESVDRGIGIDHNFINVTNNANVIIRLDTGDYLKGKPFTIKNSGTGTVTLKDALIDGIADYTMNIQNSCIEIICTGTEYKITSKYTP